MKTIQIEVPGMQSTHCELRVKNAIAKIRNTQPEQIGNGMVILNIENESIQANIIEEIEKAGYEVKKVNALSDAIMKFKTNINCSGCVAQVTPGLDGADGICHWEVDINNPDKILTVHSEGITQEEVIAKVKGAGFNIQKLA